MQRSPVKVLFPVKVCYSRRTTGTFMEAQAQTSDVRRVGAAGVLHTLHTKWAKPHQAERFSWFRRWKHKRLRTEHPLQHFNRKTGRGGIRSGQRAGDAQTDVSVWAQGKGHRGAPVLGRTPPGSEPQQRSGSLTLGLQSFAGVTLQQLHLLPPNQGLLHLTERQGRALSASHRKPSSRAQETEMFSPPSERERERVR